MKDYEKADLEIENKELKDLNAQYFRNILDLKNKIWNIELFATIEFIIIVYLGMIILL